MIENIYPKKYSNAYGNYKPQATDFALFFFENKVLVLEENNQKHLPKFKDLPVDFRQDIDYRFLFSIDEEKFFLLKNFTFDTCFENKWKWADQTVCRGELIDYEAFGCITAFQLNRWYNSNKFCGGCGGKMTASQKERALICAECGKTVYPRINPAVIIAVHNNDKLLLTKYARGSYRHYSLVAGFVEIGETFEKCVAREVMEEVGLKVKNIKYFGSQPWSFSDSVMIAFTCEVDGDDTITLEREELAVAEWFTKEELPENALSSVSIASALMKNFVENH